MSETETVEMVREDDLPDHESQLEPKPDWAPFYPARAPQRGSSPEKLATFGDSRPMGRPGQPNEVAPSVLFLACEDSRYMSG